MGMTSGGLRKTILCAFNVIAGISLLVSSWHYRWLVFLKTIDFWFYSMKKSKRFIGFNYFFFCLYQKFSSFDNNSDYLYIDVLQNLHCVWHTQKSALQYCKSIKTKSSSASTLKDLDYSKKEDMPTVVHKGPMRMLIITNK